MLVGVYFNWIIICSLALVLFVYLLFVILGLWQKLWTPRRQAGFGAQSREILVLKRTFLITVPLLIGFCYFSYNYSWRYTFSKFGDSEIGVLIADFREVALEQWAGRGQFSTMLKEDLGNGTRTCSNRAPVSFKTTPAFFTNEGEARKYGAKIGATVVIWGEVDRTDKVITIRPHMTCPLELVYGTKYLKIGVFNLIGNYSQRWRLDGSTALCVDLTVSELDHFLAWPVIAGIKSGRWNIPLIAYVECCLRHKLEYPPFIKAALLFERALDYTLKKEYGDAVNDFREAFGALEQDTLQTKEIKLYKALLALQLSKEFAKLNHQDSAMNYFSESLDIDSTVILTDTEFMQQLIDSSRTKMIYNLLVLWRNGNDTLSGDWLAKILNGETDSVARKFIDDYELKYPSRLARVTR